MTKRNPIWLLAIFCLTTVSLTEAQQAKKVPRIGLLLPSAGGGAGGPPAFRQGLRDLGYVEGKNVVIEPRYAEGKLDRLPELAGELVRLKVDVLVVGGTVAATAAKQATSTIPIVVGSSGDLVGAGVVASLARPGGNVTGVTNIDPDFSAKRLELVKEILPKVSRVAVLYHGGPGGDEEELRETQAAAHALRVQIQSLKVEDPSQFQGAYAAMKKERAGALIIFNSSFTFPHRIQLLEFAAKNRLPTICGEARWTEDGGLISYGPDFRQSWRRAAIYVDKILNGRKPSDLPVEQPMKFELVINLKTAKQLGLTVPQWTLIKADRVIR